jgi:hypothetical protein
LQGRFPIRVELEPLTRADFVRILTEPRNALVKQYIALLGTEDLAVTFTPDAVERIADFAARVNDTTENIGARRLHTVMERLLDEVSFDAPDRADKTVTIDEALRRSHARRHRAERGSLALYPLTQFPTPKSQLPTTPNFQLPTPNNFQLGSWELGVVGNWGWSLGVVVRQYGKSSCISSFSTCSPARTAALVSKEMPGSWLHAFS